MEVWKEPASAGWYHTNGCIFLFGYTNSAWKYPHDFLCSFIRGNFRTQNTISHDLTQNAFLIILGGVQDIHCCPIPAYGEQTYQSDTATRRYEFLNKNLPTVWLQCSQHRGHHTVATDFFSQHPMTARPLNRVCVVTMLGRLMDHQFVRQQRSSRGISCERRVG